ncbi:DUF1697 domain-containing protein [Devosia sp. 2618]|uniref:DUF1697 domain-containing protein n=1 Tax=Devosia sp. 2618 TaxID=3156454 RepID=UPI0033978AF7
MSRHLALLRGVNLGKRQVKSADLKAAFEAMGFANVKTLLASGNVLFDAEKPDRAAIEAALEQRFGFDVGTILRSHEQLAAMVAAKPFGARVEDHDTKLYVTFIEDQNARSLPMPCAVARDFEVVHLTDGEIYIVAHRLPNGRFGEGMDQIWKHFGKKRLWTSRNWNTVIKAAA